MKPSSIAIALLFAACLSTILMQDEKAAEREATEELKLYCKMVEIRKTTNDPYLGWPDYRGIYDKECKGD